MTLEMYVIMFFCNNIKYDLFLNIFFEFQGLFATELVFNCNGAVAIVPPVINMTVLHSCLIK